MHSSLVVKILLFRSHTLEKQFLFFSTISRFWLTRAFKWDVNTKEYMSDMTNSTFSSSSVVSVIWESAKMGGSISDKPWQALRHLRCGKKSGCLSLMSSPPFVASTALSRERKVFSRHHYSSLPLGASGRSPFIGLGLQHHLMQ